MLTIFRALNIEIQDDVVNMRNSLRETADERLAERISNWLSAPDPSINLATARKKRQQDTGIWLLNSPIFLDWKKTPGAFLWLHGKAGSGKTVLSSTAVYSISEADQKNPNVLYFYFDFQDQQKQRTQNLVKHLIVQLSDQIRVTAKVAEGLYNSHSRSSTIPMTEELTGVFQRMIERSPTTYIVIDALDECQERHSLLGFLVEMQSWNQDNLHIFVTSRRETDIEDSLGATATHRIPLEESVVDGDILIYVEHQLQFDAKLSKWPEDSRKEIKMALSNGAKGMFRWVECQLDAIRGCMKPAQLRRALKSLPKTLDDTYARILNKVGEDYVDDVHRILSCLICSYYPVAVEELAETVAIVPRGDTCYDIENRLLEPRDVLTICSGLVTTTRSRRITLMGGPQIPIEEVRLAHFSVKEYLVSDRLASKETSKFYIEERLAHEMLASLSIRYLVHCHQAELCKDPEFLLEYETGFLKRAAFAPYAASFWSHHLRAARLDISSPLYQECLKVFLHPTLLKDLIRLRRPWFQYQEVTIMRHCGYIKSFGGNHSYNLDFSSVPALYYASLLGLDHLVAMLIKEGEGVNSSTSEGTCIVAAISGGHQSTVDLLLAYGADVNATISQISEDGRTYYSRTAIHEAVAGGHRVIARKLLVAGADVNKRRWPGKEVDKFDDSNTPLQAAVYHSDRTLVGLMLHAGADPNADAGNSGTALEFISVFGKGDNAIMAMLLDAGADPNLTSNPTGILSPLFRSLVHNNLAGARLLVERGVDRQTIDPRIIDPMISNTILNKSRFEGGFETLVHIRPDMNLELALSMAAKYGYAKAIEILLQSNTSPDTQEANGTAALHAAAFTPGCNVEAVDALLGAGAEVNTQGGPLGSALQAAALSGKLQVVKLLLEKGAMINHSGGIYGSALRIARGRLEDQQMECPEIFVWKPAVGIQHFGAPKGYTSPHEYLETRTSIYKSPRDGSYEAKINIAHLQYANYQGIIDLLLSHGAADV